MKIVVGLLISNIWPAIATLSFSEPLTPRDLSRSYRLGSGSFWPCSSSQVKTINGAIQRAKSMASAAIAALDDNGVESLSYLQWFGHENAYEVKRQTIRDHHYRSVISELREPRDRAIRYFEDALVFACPSSSDWLSPCSRGEPAGLVNAENLDARVNALYICPSFFSLVTHSKMLSDWRRGRYSPSKGLVLLHEMQHANAIVTPAEYSGDIGYSVSECKGLSDSEKVKNAQNYAFFALDSAV
ncbi:Putative metallopeptidase, catalytic domain superfamily, lysine-specific metallo-endopeptidase [Colletotrichum destructivum]|uniref:Metallopeptidase, catalytic domain superfamily, lysine-specific metallo-endopeptidase n=1 Tax=Colletotrichum destructivum TaxID=34406 RepID=A0AAX4ICN4_9PEZI|nr:Putative metallopeptidase, catalytic domain superfamily, lysine-specific metallo-endopeptidase [Colletotrichum destructivum]